MAELDPIIHAAARLRIIASLAALEPGTLVAFPRLQELLGMTAGNLSTHLRKLEDADYVTIEKSFEGRVPVTFIGITLRGRAAFETYSETLKSILDTPATLTPE